jgi:hypothetical protein
VLQAIGTPTTTEPALVDPEKREQVEPEKV